MSHLLATTNPEAAAAIQPAPATDRPDVGNIVVYTMPKGYGRNGKTRFNALVQGQGPGRTLNLLVFVDAGDFIDEQFVEPAGPGVETRCWELPDDSRHANGFRGTIAALHQRIGELEEDVADLRATVLGDFNTPKVSIIGIMQDFENRLRALKQEQASAPAAPEAAPAKPKAKAKTKKR